MTAHIEKNYQERILKVLIHIQNHLDDDLSLETLADVAHFSAYHFHRIFTAYTGESVKSYVRRLRLERATRDLLFTKLSLTHISERAGYDTQQSFHRAFKEMFGMTPLEFQEKEQKLLFSHIKKTDAEPTVSVVIKKIDPITVVFKRNVGQANKIFETWLSFGTEIGLAHITAEKAQKITIPYDNAHITPTDKVRIDVCIGIDSLPDFKPSGDLGIQTIRGGKHAVITHHGSLETMEKTFELLFGIWLPKSGYEPDDHPNFILHHTIPILTQPDDMISDIYLPLK